jgi:sterol desaturase/sphingolipid hydroxylase (fatty acid hydroxylase superfamily)
MDAGDDWRLGVFLTAALVCGLAEWRYGWRRPPPDRVHIYVANLALGMLATAVMRLVLPWVATDAAIWSASVGGGLLRAGVVPGPINALLGFLALDLSVFAQHWLFHRLPWLWRLHAVHHGDTHLDVSTGLRFHPLEILVSMAWKIAVVVALGIDVAVVIAFEAVLSTATLVTHSNLRLPRSVSSAAAKLLITPALHRAHHLEVPLAAAVNYGFFLSAWDRLFGTLGAAIEEPSAELRLGLPSAADIGHNGFVKMVTQPFENT